MRQFPFDGNARQYFLRLCILHLRIHSFFRVRFRIYISQCNPLVRSSMPGFLEDGNVLSFLRCVAVDCVPILLK